MKNESRVVESSFELKSSSIEEDVSSINDSLKKELNKFWDYGTFGIKESSLCLDTMESLIKV